MRTALFVAALLVTGATSAADKPCTRADAAAADKAIDRVVSWQQLEQTWKDYRHCDAGPTAELYTDALLRLLVDWKDVPAFATAMGDRDFHQFVDAHLASGATKADRDAIYSRAKADCPRGLDKFCTDLMEAVKKPQAEAPNLEPLKPLKGPQ